MAPIVLLAVVVGVSWALFEATTRESIDTGDAPAKKLAWTADLDIGASTKEAVAGGVWFGRNLVVRGDASGLRAYDLSTGKQRWRVEPPKGLGCAMSTTTSNGIGYTLATNGYHCTRLFAVETATGEVVQRADLDIEVDPTAGPLWLAGNGIVVATNHDIVSLDPAHPDEQRWRATVGRDDCAVDKVVARDSLVLALSSCESDEEMVATAYDAESGNRKWRKAIRAGSGDSVSLLSASPPVVTIDDADIDKPTTVVGYDPRTGRERMRVKAELDGSPLDPEPDNVAFVGQTMVLGGSGIAAYDITTGDRLWSEQVGDVDFTVLHQRPGKEVYAIGSPLLDDDYADALVAFGVQGGEMRVASRLEPVKEDFPADESLTWTGRRIVAAYDRASSYDDYRTLEVYG